MSLKYLDEPGPTLGMIRDLPSWQLPKGAVYDSLNLLYDRPGMARLRMGSTSLGSTASAFCTSLGFCYSKDSTPIEELYGLDGRGGGLYSINKTSGASTLLATLALTNTTVGRPVRHFGFLVFPASAASFVSPMVAGQTTSTTFVNAAAASVPAGDPRITLTGADVTTNIRVGGIVSGFNAGGGTFVARVVSIDTTKIFSVWPAPTAALSFSPGNLSTGPVSIPVGGRCVTSFQNRLLWGNSFDIQARITSSQFSIQDRRVNYSVLPTENGSNTLGITYGATFYSPLAQPVLNYFTVPGSDPIVAMEPTSNNELLILTATHPVIFRGDLVTELATTSPSITYDVSEINEPYGCASDLTVQRTMRGITWAGAGGVFAYNGNTITNLCGDRENKRILSYWQALAADAASFVVHGSAYVRDHYIVSGTSGGATFSLACNMQNLQWTRCSGVGTDNFFAVSRPSTQQQVYAARWWDQTSAGPSMTNGQVVRLESMFKSYTAGTSTTDADANPVLFSVTSPVLAGDDATQKGFQRGTVLYQQASSTNATSVQARAGIDASDTISGLVTLGSLSSTSTLTVTTATNANPIVCTTATHGLQTGDFVDILGGLGNTNVNGRWRITVLSSTTFSLIGGIGNGAYTGSSANVRKVTEQDFQMTDLGRNQGVCFVIGAGVQVNNFELHGLRVAYLGLQPVMSA